MNTHNVDVIELGKIHTVHTRFCIPWEFRIVKVNDVYGVAIVNGNFIIPPSFHQLAYLPKHRVFIAQKTTAYNSWGALYLNGSVYINFEHEHCQLLALL